MYLLYVDESGGDEHGQDSQYFVLGGVSVFERQPYHLSTAVEEIQKRFFPESSDPIEFRASAIFNGNGEPLIDQNGGDRLLNPLLNILRKQHLNAGVLRICFLGSIKRRLRGGSRLWSRIKTGDQAFKGNQGKEKR